MKNTKSSLGEPLVIEISETQGEPHDGSAHLHERLSKLSKSFGHVTQSSSIDTYATLDRDRTRRATTGFEQQVVGPHTLH
ncbi:NAD(P)-dependent oxidoreductase [Pseudomonas sp. S31]|uniref:hypothetical protein n=1 Tax=Pseudomonas sp. S31 TaxID=1564473 RepID=UPI001913D680|nr:hypothetical protein [Pseudomonas sp. S31]MBK4998606.1 NAD(P)-dependent oxidoreductase [Pseudomonas sp. S31]